MAHFSSDRCGKCLLFGWASSALLCFCPQPPPPPTCMMYCGRVPPQPPVAPRTPPALVFYCSTDAVRLVRDGRAAALRVAPRVRRGRGASAASRPTGRRLAAVARDRRSTPPCFERLGAGSAPGVTLVCSPLFFPRSLPPHSPRLFRLAAIGAFAVRSTVSGRGVLAHGGGPRRGRCVGVAGMAGRGIGSPFGYLVELSCPA